MAARKNIEFELQGDTLIVVPTFTYRSAAEGDLLDELREMELRINENAATKNVVVDLGAIPFFGSTVLEWMVSMWKKVKSRSGSFVLCSVSPVGLQILTATRFTDLWPQAPTREAALALVRSGA